MKVWLPHPLFRHNLELLGEFVKVLEPRKEEGKLKFPQPNLLADEVSHWLLR